MNAYRRILLEILFCSATIGGISILACAFAPEYGIELHPALSMLPPVCFGVVVILLMALGVSYLSRTLPAPNGKKCTYAQEKRRGEKDTPSLARDFPGNKVKPNKCANNASKPDTKSSH